MPPIPPTNPATPRVVLYHQTHFRNNGRDFVSLMPLLENKCAITHLILGCFHLNPGRPQHVTLNDHAFNDPHLDPVWSEIPLLQAGGIKVLAMLGGACPGTFEVLDGTDTDFETYYLPLERALRVKRLDGVDLDVEEEMSLRGIIRLIDRLRADFGPEFIITLAPVANGMMGGRHLSGFDYEELEVWRGRDIAWYNTQFYNGWGTAASIAHYNHVLARGWPVEKIVLGVLTNPGNGGSGYVSEDQLLEVITDIMEKHPRFGGVMGWEYFNSLWFAEETEGEGEAWKWAGFMGELLRPVEGSDGEEEGK